MLRFGGFEVDSGSEELRKHGIRLHLPSQPFQILAALLDRPGEVVTREELHQLLWPQGPPADSDRSLNTAINRLRGALGDAAGNARYIETLPRKGYRFIAHVERIARQQESSPPPAPLPEPAISRWRIAPLRTWRGRALICAATLSLLGVTLWRANHQADTRNPGRVSALTDFPGTETTPALSPDGRRVAFSWNEGTEANLDIYVRELGSAALGRVTNTIGNAFAPSFSPDGERIAFYRRAGDSSYIHIVSVDQRNLIRIAGFGLNVGPEMQFPARSPSAPAPDLPSLSWSSSGEDLAYVDKSSPDEPYSIFVSPVSQWRGVKVTWPPPGIRGDGSPAFSPDGRSLAFARSVDESSADLFVASLSGGNPRRLTRDHSRITGITWAPDGDSIVFSSERAGLPTLWRVSIKTYTVERVRQVPEAGALPTISRAGDTLAYVRWAGREDIVEIPLQHSADTSVDPAAISLLFQNASNPEYSPDGSSVVLSAASSDRNEIWTIDAGGKNPAKLTSAGGYAASPRWSPDGQFIAFDARAVNDFGIYDIFVASATGGTPRALTSGPVQNSRPSWSSDGRFLYFASDRSGTQQIWKIPIEGGQAEQITQNGGSEAEESPDGKTLYYSRRSVPGLWSTPVDGGSETLVIPDLQWENSRNWAVADDGIYYLLREGERPSDWTFWLKHYGFQSDGPRKIAKLGNLPIVNGRCSISTSRRTLLCVQERRTETDLAVMPGFQ